MWQGKLLPEEEAFVANVVPKRRREFTAGRICARKALEVLGVRNFPVLRGKDRQRTMERVDAFARRLYRHPLASETRISGPAPAPLERLKGYWRFQILVRQTSASRLRTLITESLIEKVSKDLVLDVDPQDLL